MLIIKLMGGLGNQLFQIATTLAVSWDYEVKSVFIRKDPQGYKYAQRKSYWDTVLYKLNIVDNTKLDFCTHTESWNHTYSKIQRPSKNLKLNGFFQTSKYFNKYYEKILNTFTLTDKNMDIVNKNISQLRNKNKKLIGIHVRRTDYIKINWELPLQYYINAMSLFDKDVIFVCFSDDIEWCKNNIKNVVYCENNKDYIDLFMLSKMDGYIMSNSSFSWWAVFLGNKDKNKKVIVPKKPWFRNNNYNKDIYEKDWILI